MHHEQRLRTAHLLTNHGLEHALFSHPHSVTWLTGFAAPLQLGPHPFSGGHSLVWYASGHYTLIVQEAFQKDTHSLEAPDLTVVTHPDYTIHMPIASFDHLSDTLRRRLDGKSPKRIGIEVQNLPYALAATLPEGADIIATDGWLLPLRAIKTPEEIEKLKASFALTDLGHKIAREVAQNGMREIDIWTAVHSAIERAAGRRVPLGNDCVVGYRDVNIGGWPQEYPLREYDSLIIDLSVVLNGYWSDSCATLYVTEPSPHQKAIHQTVRDALEFAISLVGPGVSARDIDARVREFIRAAGYPVYPHHTGHSVGLSVHEAPRIVPYNNEILKPNMVILLEPGIYFPGEMGVRLEDAVLVTESGVELLTHHEKGY